MIFQPQRGAAWHGVGQDPDGIADYLRVLPPELRPAIVSSYTAVHPEWTTFQQWRGYTREELVRQFDLYPDHIHHLAVPMCVARADEASTPWIFTDLLASGALDSHLRDLGKCLAPLKHPVLLRPGFEFNGDWNGYEPQSFVKAFRRFVDVVNDTGARVSWVWHGVTHTPGLPEWMRWYPGDNYVDWLGLSCFRKGHLGDVKGGAWVRDAQRLGKPLMICEAGPMMLDIGADPDTAWAEWYQHYFDFISRYDACQAFVYINQEFTKFPIWKEFGDTRLHRSPATLQRFVERLRHPKIVHAELLRPGGPL
jgi:hypothetical protein